MSEHDTETAESQWAAGWKAGFAAGWKKGFEAGVIPKKGEHEPYRRPKFDEADLAKRDDER